MTFFKWLYPGMRIKRWILLFTAGTTIVLLVALYGIKTISEHSIFAATFVAACVIFGIFTMVTSVKNIVRTFVRAVIPHDESELVNIIYQKRHERTLERGPRVVVVGGGTGLSVLLQGIKEYTKNISAIVTVTDTGGSSGRLRDEFDMLPPGDIRNCLVALADAPLLGDLFQYRFQDGHGLKGHNFGNLFITAMSQVTGCFDRAVKESSKVLAIRGNVIPSTLEKVTLVATFTDGTTAEGETTIVDTRKPIREMILQPAGCAATREAVEAIENADLIILGPGSLYTSVLPNLLITDIAQAVIASDAYKIYISNVMTQPGETDHMSAFDHINTLVQHVGGNIVDACLINTGDLSDDMKKKYAEQGQFPVPCDGDKMEELGIRVLRENVIHLQDKIRHSPELLAKAIFDNYLKYGVQDSNGEE